MRSVHTTRAHPHTHSVSVLISLETAAGSGRPKGMPKGGLVFIAALKQGSVFILGGIHSAFRVKCKRADVFSYYPPQSEARAFRAERGRRSRRREEVVVQYFSTPGMTRLPYLV